MVKLLKILLVVVLTAVLVAGLTANVCCNGVDDNGDNNGDVPNGNEPNGDVPNGDVPNGDLGSLDLISGFGVITSAEEYGGSGFQGSEPFPAPDFTFEDANGQTFSLSDFKGKSVMINFWRTTCGWCVYEMPYIQQVYESWPDDEVVIITIDINEYADTVSEFLDEIEVSLPVILDIEAEVTVQYRVSSMPRTFFIDKDGVIRGIMPGAFQSVEEIEDILEQLVNF